MKCFLRILIVADGKYPNYLLSYVTVFLVFLYKEPIVVM